MNKILEYLTQLESAKKNSTPTTPITSKDPDFSLTEAYEVQSAGLEKALSQGLHLGGYKMGLTSFAKQKDVNVFEPIYGYLLKENEVRGTLSSSSLIHPRVEPEVYFKTNTSLTPKELEQKDFLDAIDSVGIAFEIIDSRFKDFKFNLPDVVADNTSAAHFALGQKNFKNQLDKIRLMGVIFSLNGEIVDTGAPAAVLGHPLFALKELILKLDRQNKSLPPSVVLTGGITASAPIKKGDVLLVECPFDTLELRVQ